MRFSDKRAGNAAPSPLKRLHCALVVQFVLELLTGGILSAFYRPAAPYPSVVGMHRSWLALLQGFHYWQSSLLILEGVLLIVALVWTGEFIGELRPTYYSTLLIFFASMGFQITGNLLPFDRHGVGTAVIESSIAARVPVVGGAIQNVALGGAEFTPSTVSVWYGAHWAVTILALGALGLGYGSVRKQLSGAVIAASAAPAALLALFVASPLGSLASAQDFDSFTDRASWYTWPLHGALVMTSRVNASLGWVGAILIPGVVTAFLLILPTLRGPLLKSVGRWGLGVSALFFGFAAVGFGGPIDGVTGTRDPVAVRSSGSTKGTQIDRLLAAKGRTQFNSKGCSGCHGLDGLHGTSGPTLAHVQDRHPDASYFVRYVKNPQSVDPNSTMPAFPQLGASDLSAIAEYLRSPKQPG